MRSYTNLDFLEKVADDFYFVHGEHNGQFPSCNGFLLTGEETVLIDAGIGETQIRDIDLRLRIDVLLITHSHPDHIRYWHILKDRFIYLPEQTPAVVKDLQLLGERFTGSRDGGRAWAHMVGVGFGVRPLREVDARYTDGDILELGAARLQAIHTPGHVRDHYCFLDHNTGTLITTDIDLTSFGPWYGNPESSIEELQADIRKVMALPYSCICTSHNDPVRGDATSLFQDYLAHFERHRALVRQLCSPPKTLEQMIEASPFYRNKLPQKEIQNVFEYQMITKNLALLIADGEVEENEGTYRIISE